MKLKKTRVRLVPLLVSVFVISLLCTTAAADPAAQTADTKEAGQNEKALEEGRKVFDKVVSALGGAERLAGIKNYAVSMSFVRIMETEIMEMDAIGVIEYPNKTISVIWNRRGAFIMAVDGDKGWRRNPPGPLEQMGADFVTSQLSASKRDVIYMSNNRDEYNFRLIGEKEHYGKKVIDMHITGPIDYHMYIDPKTYLPVGGSYQTKTSSRPDPVLSEDFYYDYKTIDGINTPFRTALRAFGSIYAGTTVKEMIINLDLPADFFKGTLEETYEKMRDGKWKQN